MTHSVGMVLFPLIASLVIAQSGWRDAWFVLGVMVWVIALLPVSLLIAQRPEDVGLHPDGDESEEEADESASQQEEPAWTLKEAMKTPALWILAVATGLLFLMQAGTNTHAAAFFRDQGLTATTAGLGISLNAAFLGVGGIVWGRVVESVPARFVMAAVALVMAVASALFITTDTAIEAYAYSALFGFGLGGMLTIPPVAYADYFGRQSLGAIRGITEPFTTLRPGHRRACAGRRLRLPDHPGRGELPPRLCLRLPDHPRQGELSARLRRLRRARPIHNAHNPVRQAAPQAVTGNPLSLWAYRGM